MFNIHSIDDIGIILQRYRIKYYYIPWNLEFYFMENILKGTAFNKENKTLKLSNVDLSAIPEGAAKDSMKTRLQNMSINIKII